jgi:hypothetical protein
LDKCGPRIVSAAIVSAAIVSAAIASRVKGHILDKLISESQKGCVENRYIGECTCLVYDIPLETKKKDIAGLLPLVDFERAFDSVERPFIQRALRFFGFKNDFCKWVNLLYTDITSSVTNNGHNSDYFSQNRGVCQGDPFSPYLFILVVEILSAALKINLILKVLN